MGAENGKMKKKEGRKKNREYERDMKKRKGSVKEQRGRQVRWKKQEKEKIPFLTPNNGKTIGLCFRFSGD